MKKLAIVALAATALTTGAFANNKHAGPWVGLSLGVGLSHGSLDFTGPVEDSKGKIDASTRGILGGLHAGWDWTFENKWLLGIELLGEISSMDGKSVISERDAGVGAERFGSLLEQKIDMDWSFGVSARGGVIYGDTVIYLHAGWIGSEWELKSISTDRDMNDAVDSKKNDKFLSGFRAGIGFDTMLNENVSFGGEWAYTWYSSVDSVLDAADDPVSRVKYDPDTSVFRVNLKYKFKGLS